MRLYYWATFSLGLCLLSCGDTQPSGKVSHEKGVVGVDYMYKDTKLGNYTYLAVREDSIVWAWGLGNAGDTIQVKTEDSVWKSLLQSFSADDFSKVKSSSGRQALDGTDQTYTLHTARDTISFKNAAYDDPAWQRLKSLMKVLAKIEAELNEHVKLEYSSAIASKKVPRILLPAAYRVIDGMVPAQQLNKDWLGIFQQTYNRFSIKKADFTVSSGFDPCSGDSTKIIHSRRNDLLFMENIGIPEGEITAISMAGNRLWPGETIRLTDPYKGFKLIAEGEKSNHQQVYTDEGPEDWYDVSRYKLYLQRGTASRVLLLEEAYFEDTFLQVIFAGDINGDYFPDFIMDVPRHYEETRVLLLLSEYGGAELQYQTAEVVVPGDC